MVVTEGILDIKELVREDVSVDIELYVVAVLLTVLVELVVVEVLVEVSVVNHEPSDRNFPKNISYAPGLAITFLDTLFASKIVAEVD